MNKKYIIGKLAKVHADCIRQKEVIAVKGCPDDWTNDPDAWDDMAVLLVEAINYLIENSE